MLYKVLLTFESVDKMHKFEIQMKAVKKYFSVVLFIMLYKVVLTFESVDEILKCDHLKWKYLAAPSCDTVIIMLHRMNLADKRLRQLKC